jgi:hypothetical protein
MLARANLLQSKVGGRVQPAGRTVLAPSVRPCRVYAKGEVIPSKCCLAEFGLACMLFLEVFNVFSTRRHQARCSLCGTTGKKAV